MTTLTLQGVDGSQWELVDPLSPVQLVGGMGGLHLPPSTGRWAATARRSGRRWKDAVTDARTFTMNVRVGDVDPPFRTGDDWRALDSQFWDALAFDRRATLVFNGQRRLNFRLGDDNDHEFPKDPALLGKAVYSIDCVADRPEWLGLEQTTTFTFGPTSPVDYYGGAAQGPPFTISPAASSKYATVTNDGDLSTYPGWRIVGPGTNASVGVGDHTIPIPFALQSGQQVIIDTEAQTITDGTGANLWPSMGSTPVDFAAIPAGGAVPIVVRLENGTETSLIEATITPRYRRAW